MLIENDFQEKLFREKNKMQSSVDFWFAAIHAKREVYALCLERQEVLPEG